MENQKNKNKYLSTLEWILSIGGIVVISLLIILPPVFRIVLKDKKEKGSFIDQLEIKTLVCSKDNFVSEGAYSNNVVTITYYNNRIRTYSIRQEKKFNTIEEYDAYKQQSGLLSSAYDQVNGIDYVVNAVDADLRITTVEDCNLSIFKSTVVTLPGNEQEFKINSAYSTRDTVDEIRGDLEEEKYICR